MKNTPYKIIATLIVIWFSQCMHAQDIIIKNDKQEIKAKVLEVESTVVKYKPTNHKDGPIYNIPKQEVFMIIYANGKREHFDGVSSTKLEEKEKPLTTDSNKPIEQPLTETAVHKTANPDSIEDISIYFWTVSSDIIDLSEGGFNVRLLFEGSSKYKFAKNYFRIGYSMNLYGNTGWTSYGLLVNVTPHLPVNRLMHRYEKQNLGLFPYLRLGLGTGYTNIEYKGHTDTTFDFLHQVAFGVDYIFTKKFAFTVFTDKFETLSVGISLDF